MYARWKLSERYRRKYSESRIDAITHKGNVRTVPNFVRYPTDNFYDKGYGKVPYRSQTIRAGASFYC